MMCPSCCKDVDPIVALSGSLVMTSTGPSDDVEEIAVCPDYKKEIEPMSETQVEYKTAKKPRVLLEDAQQILRTALITSNTAFSRYNDVVAEQLRRVDDGFAPDTERVERLAKIATTAATYYTTVYELIHDLTHENSVARS